jgi:hypothetical protein
MTTQEVKRKLTAILSADVKGYSRFLANYLQPQVAHDRAHEKIIFEISLVLETLGANEQNLVTGQSPAVFIYGDQTVSEALMKANESAARATGIKRKRR